jgi:hypothetical protein
VPPCGRRKPWQGEFSIRINGLPATKISLTCRVASIALAKIIYPAPRANRNHRVMFWPLQQDDEQIVDTR